VNQSQLNQAVARATGESVHTIAGLGFSLLSLPKPARRSRRSRCRCGPRRRRDRPLQAGQGLG
jgi:hypothetical protein